MKRVAVYSDTRERLLYSALAVARVVLTCIPQTGYIHPDEFFQSIEILAGKTFNLEINQPWEFNRTFPIRSPVMSYFLVGYPYRLLNMLDNLSREYWNVKLRSPYLMVVFPRLMICLLSFLIDLSLYKICQINRFRDRWRLMFILSSSYVLLIYGTRTFSNSNEMILFSLLLWLVTDCQKATSVIDTHRNFLQRYHSKCKSPADRARILKILNSIPSNTLHHGILIGLIVSLGVFNRPTFIAFAAAPVFFYLHPSSSPKHGLQFHARCIALLCTCGIMSIILITFDSFYFGYLTTGEILYLDISMNNFVVTPLNFIRYNIDKDNLAQHGLHPKYLHILVNIPLLYNILGVIAILGTMSALTYRRFSLPRLQDVRALSILSIIIPLAVLSNFPHQEPRFLIPITLPLILLCGRKLFQSRTYFRLWCIINIAFVYFYGFVHQSGVWQAATEPAVINSVQTHLYTSHVYSVPLSLLEQPDHNQIRGTGKSKYKLKKSIILHEMGSQSLPSVMKLMQIALNTQHKVFLIVPTSKGYELTHENMTFQPVKYLYPHLSLEAPPDLITIFYENIPILDKGLHLLHSFGLGLYEAQSNSN